MQKLFAGIDLGTMHSVVATSNGMRRVIPTEIGWAKDPVAAERLGTEPLFGEALDKNRLALRTLRPLQKGILKSNYESDMSEGDISLAERIDATGRILGYALQSVAGKESLAIRGILGIPAISSRRCINTLLNVAQQWMETVVLVPEPFAVGYSLGLSDPALIVDIGAGTTDVCHYYGALPTESDQTTIHFGGDHVDELIYQHLLADYPGISISLRTVKNLKEKLGVLDGSAAPIVIRVPSGKQLAKEIDVTVALQAALGKLAEAVYEGICEVLSSMPPEHHSVALSNVILAGGGSQLPGLCSYLEELLHPCGPSNVKRIADSCYAGANGALRLAMELPEDAWAELAKADHLAPSETDAVSTSDNASLVSEMRGAA